MRTVPSLKGLDLISTLPSAEALGYALAPLCVRVRTRIGKLRWDENTNPAPKTSPQGGTIIAQGVPGSPTRAVFARVGVVEPWVKWEISPSPVETAEVATQSPSGTAQSSQPSPYGCCRCVTTCTSNGNEATAPEAAPDRQRSWDRKSRRIPNCGLTFLPPPEVRR